jgi:hypothetical protein
VVSDLAWNTFRDHLVLEYEIPKYDGDLIVPNAYVELSAAIVPRKLRILREVFGSQRAKRWFSDETFHAPAAPAGDRVCRALRVRGGLPCAQGDADVTPTVTVAVPVYNGARYLMQALDAHLAQTLTDFELLVLDNCSSDDTLRIAETIAQRDGRVRVVRQTRNIGASNNYNAGVRLARGAFFRWVQATTCGADLA